MLRKIKDLTHLENSKSSAQVNKNLIQSQWKSPIVRQTIVVPSGLYIFDLQEEVNGFFADYLFYPNEFENEKEVDCLVAQYQGNYSSLFKVLLSWVQTSSFGGYDLTYG